MSAATYTTTRFDAWATSHQAEAAYLRANANSHRFLFPGDMVASINRYGQLTPGQLAAVQKCMAREVEFQARAAIQRASAPAVAADTLAKIEDAFKRAAVASLKAPKLRLDRFVFAPAKATSANAGSIYVNSKDRKDENDPYGRGLYLGKIAGAQFLRARACTDDEQRAIVAAASDPENAAIAFGKNFGMCSVCGRDLTDQKSIDRGIGPVCATKYGW